LDGQVDFKLSADQDHAEAHTLFLSLGTELSIHQTDRLRHRDDSLLEDLNDSIKAARLTFLNWHHPFSDARFQADDHSRHDQLCSALE
jgi:hypothetical protein